MGELVSRRDLVRLTKGLGKFPDVARVHIYTAQRQNAQEAAGYMQALVPNKDGVTRANTVAAAYRHNSGETIGFAMMTSRPNRPGANTENKQERIKAILFANNTDFFYGVWRLNKKSWRGRMRRAMSKSAREIAGRIK